MGQLQTGMVGDEAIALMSTKESKLTYAIALPTGFDKAMGLPVGVHLVGRPAGEATILAMAAQLERELG